MINNFIFSQSDINIIRELNVAQFLVTKLPSTYPLLAAWLLFIMYVTSSVVFIVSIGNGLFSTYTYLSCIFITNKIISIRIKSWKILLFASNDIVISFKVNIFIIIMFINHCRIKTNQVDVLWLHRCNRYLQLNFSVFLLSISELLFASLFMFDPCIFCVMPRAIIGQIMALGYALNLLTYINTGVFINVVVEIPILF